MAQSTNYLRFQPVQTIASPSFFAALAKLKLDTLKVQKRDDLVPFSAEYQLPGHAGKGGASNTPLNPIVYLDQHAFEIGQEERLQAGGAWSGVISPGRVRVKGLARICESLDEMKSTDKGRLIEDSMRQLKDAMIDCAVTLSECNICLLLCHADLKKHIFYSFFAFPSISTPSLWSITSTQTEESLLCKAASMQSMWQSLSRDAVGKTFNSWRTQWKELGTVWIAYFSTVEGVKQLSFLPIDAWSQIADEDRILVILDPCTTNEPSWFARNILTSITSRHPGMESVDYALTVLFWRDMSLPPSLTENEDPAIVGAVSYLNSKLFTISLPTNDTSTLLEGPVVGWQRNNKGALAPNVFNLSTLMQRDLFPFPAEKISLTVLSAEMLADQAIDLNLKLMRWRLLPDLELGKITSAKCLLLGAGTLGCYVARALMNSLEGWGIRHITFVDSGKVSFSNPARQPLFTFADCLNGGRLKAECAASRLKDIFPGMVTRGHQMSIPMPGHPLSNSETHTVEQTVTLLETLIREHDVIYLLMDSRESRWLPTMLGAQQNKVRVKVLMLAHRPEHAQIVINAALGFDNYLVMRHGGTDMQNKLSCYYCQDITGPRDSLSDRTLDQMCTVSRPGLAPIASGTAVELMASLLTHPLGVQASVSEDRSDHEHSSQLGSVPHQIRGWLSKFSVLQLTGSASDNCTACSRNIIDAYVSQGFKFLERVFNDAEVLEQISGLQEQVRSFAETLDKLEPIDDWSDDEQTV